MSDHDMHDVRHGERLLVDIRQALLRLHKTLLEWEQSGYERIHGRQSSHALLKALLSDPQFAWLRPMSQLIVRIDEVLEEKTAPTRNDVDAIVEQVKVLTSPDENGNSYQRRYDMALQEHPDAVFAHRDLLAVFRTPKKQ